MSDPLGSVGIPTYNRAGVISQTIENIFQQTYRNFELIIVDDGSTDDTQAKLRQYGDRIRVVTQANSGPAVARNRGAGLARGEIIAFQDSDDLWKPTKLERQVALMEMDRSIPCCLCSILLRVINGKSISSFDYSLVRLRHEEGIWENVLDVLATRFVMFIQAAAIRRQAFEKVGGFAEDLKYLEDYYLPLRLSLEGPWAFIREPLVIYGEGSPMSYSERAKKDPVVLVECEMLIYERILALVEGINGYAGACRSLKRRLGLARRQLRTSKLPPERSITGTVGKLLVHIDRYRLAALRKSPWFPQPKTVPSKSKM
jgi:glycosyltransferase involved in cell wall biosynthesis